MASDKLQLRFQEIERLARAAGLDFYDVNYFEVPPDVIWQTAAYGLPTRFSHWSFGRAYSATKASGEMGFSKIYELIIANDPSIAYLDNTNPDTINLLICCHCFGHSHFFKKNIMFREHGETKMVDVASQHAAIIDQFRIDYGDDAVDEWIDIAMSLERHIDVYRGRHRERYPQRHVSFQERKKLPWEDILLDKNVQPQVKRIIEGIHIPPKPEKDILWFLCEYSNLDFWQKKIFEIVRRESYYFYAQFITKIINEGTASYFHAELMHQYALGNKNEYGIKDLKYPLTAEEHLDFLAAHEKVVQPGIKVQLKNKNGNWHHYVNNNVFNAATRINPYYVGFRIFRDIKERWDEYYKQGYMINDLDEKIPVTINGHQKVLEVIENENDVSFLRKYLTEELASSLKLFCYGNSNDYKDTYDIQETIQESSKMTNQESVNKTLVVKNNDLHNIITTFAASKSNYGVPSVVIRRIDESGLMRLEHIESDRVNLDIKYAEHMLRYIYYTWRRPIELVRKEADRTWILAYNGEEFEVNYATKDYPESVEKNDIPSSW